jgi:hypothetical protein
MEALSQGTGTDDSGSSLDGTWSPRRNGSTGSRPLGLRPGARAQHQYVDVPRSTVLDVDGHATGAKRVTGRTCVSGEPLAVGANKNPSKGLLEAFWDGRLDDVRVHDRALSPEAVRQLTARPRPPDLPETSDVRSS